MRDISVAVFFINREERRRRGVWLDAAAAAAAAAIIIIINRALANELRKRARHFLYIIVSCAGSSFFDAHTFRKIQIFCKSYPTEAAVKADILTCPSCTPPYAAILYHAISKAATRFYYDVEVNTGQ